MQVLLSNSFPSQTEKVKSKRIRKKKVASVWIPKVVKTCNQYIYIYIYIYIKSCYNQWVYRQVTHIRAARPVMSVFGSVVAGAFQIAFCAEMHANNVFLFFKNHFWHQHIKTIQKVQTALNFSKKKKKNSNLEETQVQTQYQTFPITQRFWTKRFQPHAFL